MKISGAASAVAQPRGRLHYFALLDSAEQQTAIRRLAAAGMSPHLIATAAQLRIDQVLNVLGQPPASGTP